jgi:predicted  nucleic acid-binding Zn-ribbon protein
MDRLEQAQQRLESALARLEKAAAKPASGAADEIAALRRRCDALEESSREVSARLDAAIGKIRGLLEG